MPIILFSPKKNLILDPKLEWERKQVSLSLVTHEFEVEIAGVDMSKGEIALNISNFFRLNNQTGGPTARFTTVLTV